MPHTGPPTCAKTQYPQVATRSQARLVTPCFAWVPDSGRYCIFALLLPEAVASERVQTRSTRRRRVLTRLSGEPQTLWHSPRNYTPRTVMNQYVKSVPRRLVSVL